MVQQSKQPGKPVVYGTDAGIGKPLEETVLYEKVDKHIAKVILNRPEKGNALYLPEMWTIFRKQMDLAIQDDDVKVVILCGNGDTFCAGDDLRRAPSEGFGLKPGQRLPQSRRILGFWNMRENLLRSTLYSPKTVIASVQGGAIAAGMTLALTCDLVICSEDAYMAHPGMRIGFGGADPGMYIALLKMGINRSREMLLTTRKVYAKELKEWGVVNSIVPRAKLEEETMRYAKAIAAHATDGLMIGRMMMQMFYDLMGTKAGLQTQVCMAHPLFTNLVWRDDEFNFLKYRNEHGLKEAFEAQNRIWGDLGFE